MIRTVQAEQAHAVPQHSYMQRGLFDPAITHTDLPVTSETQVDEMGQYFEPGATAQNGYRAPRYLQCQSCGLIMPAADADTHDC